MSVLLATALLAAPATLPSCSWDRPGVNPFVGDVVAAVDRYADIPADVRGKLKARMAKRQYDEIATITRDGISGKARYEAAIRDMHFGAGQVCNTVTRSRWSSSHQERGLVYCESGHCIIVPTVCRNVSRITRLQTQAEAVESVPAAEQRAEQVEEEAPVITAGGGDEDESLPRLRTGGVFGGIFAPAGAAPSAGAVGGASAPVGPGWVAALGSAVSTVKKAVREVLDLVTSMPLLGGAGDPGPSPQPTAVTSSPVAPAAPATPAETPAAVSPPATTVTAADPAVGSDSGPSQGGDSGSSADPGPTTESLTPVVVLTGDDPADQDGTGGDTGLDQVDDVIEQIDRDLDDQSSDDDGVGGDTDTSDLIGDEGDGGLGDGDTDLVQDGGTDLPEPATSALVLLAGLAAALRTRRRMR